MTEPVAARNALAAVLAALEPTNPPLTPAATETAGSRANTVYVDATGANPRGRTRYGPDLPDGVLHPVEAASGFWWQIATAGTVVAAGRIGDPLDDSQTSALARLGAVAVPAAPVDLSATVWASALVQLAMTGVVLRAPALNPAVAALLAPELVDLMGTALPGRDADPLAWELRGVAQRRAALRGHGLAGSPVAGPPSVSALLVTRRPTHVAGAVAALAAQSYPELEIVVGLHGFDLPARFPAPGVPVQVLTLPAELTLGEALGVVTRAARGSLVTKVDDDDQYGPEHVWDLVLARHYSAATVVGKAAEFVHLAQYDTTVRRRMGSEFYTDVVAGGAMLLSRGDLEGVGGWQPLPRSVDRALLDAVLRAGGLVYRTHGFGFIYSRHTDGHTWDPGLRYFLRDPIRSWPGLPPYGEFG